jgi:hypothetical protein
MTIYVVHFVYTWYIFPVLVSCTKKNLATLARILLSQIIGWKKYGSVIRSYRQCWIYLLCLHTVRRVTRKIELFAARSGPLARHEHFGLAIRSKCLQRGPKKAIIAVLIKAFTSGNSRLTASKSLSTFLHPHFSYRSSLQSPFTGLQCYNGKCTYFSH